MIINKELFTYCYAPDEGIIRVWLKEDASLLPEELLDYAMQIDGVNFTLGFGIDIIEDGRAIIWYDGISQDIRDIDICDNKQDVIDYFNNNANEKDLEIAYANTPYEIIE